MTIYNAIATSVLLLNLMAKDNELFRNKMRGVPPPTYVHISNTAVAQTRSAKNAYTFIVLFCVTRVTKMRVQSISGEKKQKKRASFAKPIFDHTRFSRISIVRHKLKT